jgi:hypothetical protein
MKSDCRCTGLQMHLHGGGFQQVWLPRCLASLGQGQPDLRLPQARTNILRHLQIFFQVSRPPAPPGHRPPGTVTVVFKPPSLPTYLPSKLPAMSLGSVRMGFSLCPETAWPAESVVSFRLHESSTRIHLALLYLVRAGSPKLIENRLPSHSSLKWSLKKGFSA